MRLKPDQYLETYLGTLGQKLQSETRANSSVLSENQGDEMNGMTSYL